MSRGGESADKLDTCAGASSQESQRRRTLAQLDQHPNRQALQILSRWRRQCARGGLGGKQKLDLRRTHLDIVSDGLLPHLLRAADAVVTHAASGRALEHHARAVQPTTGDAAQAGGTTLDAPKALREKRRSPRYFASPPLRLRLGALYALRR